MASRKVIIGTAEISANESASTLTGCSLFCAENPEGWNFELDSRGAAELVFEVRVRGDDDDDLEDNLEALLDELRYIIGKTIKLAGSGGVNSFVLPLDSWPTFYGRYTIKTDSEGAIVTCTMTADALGDGTDPGSDGQIGTTTWTVHIAAGGLVTAQGQAMFNTLDDATAYISDLAAGSATLPDWMGSAYKFFDAQLDTRQVGATPLGGTGVPVHVEMRQKQEGPTVAAFDNVKDWEYSLSRVETQPYVALDDGVVGKPVKLANLSGSFQFKTQSASDLIAGDTPDVAPQNIFREADKALDALIDWVQTAQATVVEVPGARKLTPSFPNSQVAFETVLAILGGPNDSNVIRWQESLTFSPEADVKMLKTYKGRRRPARSAGLDVSVSHKFLCESITPQPYLAPISPPGRWMFGGGKIPRPAKNQGGSRTATYVTDGEVTWLRASRDESDIIPGIPELSGTRFAISEENFG